MTVFHQPDRHRYLLSLVNFQKDLPNIPVEGIDVRDAAGERDDPPRGALARRQDRSSTRRSDGVVELSRAAAGNPGHVRVGNDLDA